MKRLLISSVLSCVSLLCGLPQDAVPVLKEPRHQVKFENEYVRVIEARLPPADATLFHTHSIDNVPVVISGGKLRTEIPGRQETYSTAEKGSASFAKASYTHRITNIGSTPLWFIDAEVLKSPGSMSAEPLAGVKGYKLFLENERVRIYRIMLKPGESSGPHIHALAGLHVEVSGGRITVRSGSDKAKTSEPKPGEFNWHAGKWNHSINNHGSASYEAVEIEWK